MLTCSAPPQTFAKSQGKANTFPRLKVTVYEFMYVGMFVCVFVCVCVCVFPFPSQDSHPEKVPALPQPLMKGWGRPQKGLGPSPALYKGPG